MTGWLPLRMRRRGGSCAAATAFPCCRRMAGVPERQKESLIYSEYNYGGNGASYQDFLSHHKSSPRGLQQVVFVDGLKGVRFNISGTDPGLPDL